jgi:hypothetical protein
VICHRQVKLPPDTVYATSHGTSSVARSEPHPAARTGERRPILASSRAPADPDLSPACQSRHLNGTRAAAFFQMHRCVGYLELPPTGWSSAQAPWSPPTLVDRGRHRYKITSNQCGSPVTRRTQCAAALSLSNHAQLQA